MEILCPFLGAACVFDYSYRRIPNHLVLVLFGIGLGYMGYIYSWKGMIGYLLNTVLVSAAFYLFFKLGMLGAGDVKLLGVAAGFFRGYQVLWFLLYTMMAAAIVAIFTMVCKRNIRKRFSYLTGYLKECILRGEVNVYIKDREEKVKTGVALSGPILFSAILHWGGLF